MICRGLCVGVMSMKSMETELVMPDYSCGNLTRRQGNVAAMIFACIIITSLTLPCVRSHGNLTTAKKLLYDLMYDYDKDVRPVANFEDILRVTFEIRLKSIQDFDAVRQSFEFGAGFVLTWYDAGLVWDEDAYDGIWKIEASYGRVWTPDFILATSSEESLTYGKRWQKISYLDDGFAYWLTVGLIKSTCRVNVRNYPFDTQICTAQFILWGYNVNEVVIQLDKTAVDLSEYTESGSWELESTSVSKGEIHDIKWPQVDVKINLRRKTEFVLTNVLAPLFILDLMNLLVFLLVAESGERVSYCITVLLAITVFLTIISDTLPESSEPMPIISYKLMMDLVLSALITVATIGNLHLYHTDDRKEIPTWMKRLYGRLACVCTNKRNRVRTIQPIEHDVVEKTLSTGSVSTVSTCNPNLVIDNWTESDQTSLGGKVTRMPAGEVKVTWKNISIMMDYVFLVIFLLAFVASSAIYIINVTYFI